MAKIETSTATIIFNDEKANATLKQLEAEARKLNAELRRSVVMGCNLGDDTDIRLDCLLAISLQLHLLNLLLS